MESFKDAKGRVWTPRVTVDSAARFEERSGVGMFEASFKAFEADKANGGPVFDTARLAKMCGAMWGNLGNLSRFVYESCSGQNPGVTYEDFARSITRNEIRLLMKCALGAMFDFFPNVEDLGPEVAKAATDPTQSGSPGAGEPSLNLQAPLESILDPSV